MVTGKQMLVSIVISNYNYGCFLGQAVDSVLRQTYPCTEVIVVDDGSTDRSRKIIADYGTRVVPVLKENGGQASALNAGYAASHGEVICFLDADDVWFPDKLVQVVDALQREPRAAWLRHKLEMADEKLRPIGIRVPAFRGSRPIPPDPFLYVERAVNVSTSALVVRRCVAERVFPMPERELDQNGSPGATALVYDADAYVNVMIGAERVWGYSLDKVLGYYRRHEGQQFHGSKDTIRELERQIAVSLATSGAWAQKANRRYTATSVYKHQLVLAVLDGQRVWAGERWMILTTGLRQVQRMLTESPKLALRQTVALLYAFAVPWQWLERLRRRGSVA